MYMPGGTLCFKGGIPPAGMIQMDKRWTMLYRSGNERTFSNLAELIPNSGINFESKEVYLRGF